MTWTGDWQISAAGEIPLDHPESFRGSGDMALAGDLVYASGGANVVLQKPAFVARVDQRVVSISHLKAGLWGGNLDAQRIQVDLPSKERRLRVEDATHTRWSAAAIDRRQFWRGIAGSHVWFRWIGRAPGKSAGWGRFQ